MHANHLKEAKSSNNMKTYLLMGFFLVAIVLLGFLVSFATGNNSYFWFALVGALFLNVVSYFFSDSLALISARAIPADKEKYAELYQIISTLAEKNTIPEPKVYIINDPGPNAFATGRNEHHASIAVTTGLLAMMHKSELEGVIAHEISHIKHRDILIMTVVVVLAGVLSMLAHIALIRGNERDKDNNALFVLLSVIAALVLPIAASLIQLAISRKREFMADAGGALTTGYPEGLASALEKIGSYRQPLQNASPSTAHLYISTPFGGTERQTSFQKLFMTHPPIEERIAVLRGTDVAKDPSLP